MSISERLAAVRAVMRINGLDCCIISSADPHQSEYTAEYFQFRTYLTGFTGSAGTLIIMSDRSLLWTDGRYALQAEKELANTEISVMLYETLQPPIIPWLCQNLRSGQVVGVDSCLFPLRWFVDAKKELALHQIRLSDIHTLLDSIFDPRPAFPANPIYPLAKEYTGYTTDDKIALIRAKMKERELQNYLISSLDDIAWLCNLRGSDVLHTPVFYAYFLMERENAILFVQLNAMTAEAMQSMKKSGIQVLEYHEIESHLSHITLGPIYLCPDRVNAHICHILERNNRLITGEDIVMKAKSIKHPDEIASSREAHHQDGAAMVRVLRYIHENEASLTELKIAQALWDERKKESLFKDFSFAPIVGHGPHGAIVHYSATKETDVPIKNGLTVIDSGGQFIGATTDITRTLCTGALTEEERTDYTLTLKAHIALASSLFCAGATGAQLDGIARHIMWAHTLDYKHGTGHGVGAMLSVHEGPQALRSTNFTRFAPGMTITIEPGVYKENKHGVRIENLYVVVEKVKNDMTFLAFECLTLCPIDTTPLRRELLSEEEVTWLNTYHQKVRKELSPRLSAEDLLFLETTTRPI